MHITKDLQCKFQHILLVGCGGVGSWLAHLLVRLLPKITPRPRLTLQDGDKLEEKNLDRQLFDVKDIGKNKAEALAVKFVDEHPYVDYEPSFFHSTAELPHKTLVFCCCDNHAARKYVLDAVDRAAPTGSAAILAANETIGAEAYLYLPEWKDSPTDPRVYFPEILEDVSNDPTHELSCAALAQSTTPQLALANYMAAGQAAYLFWFLLTDAKLLIGEDQAIWPVHHCNSLAKFMSYKFMDKETQHKERQERNSNGNNTNSTSAGAAAEGISTSAVIDDDYDDDAGIATT